jgi:hypothetical protein
LVKPAPNLGRLTTILGCALAFSTLMIGCASSPKYILDGSGKANLTVYTFKLTNNLIIGTNPIYVIFDHHVLNYLTSHAPALNENKDIVDLGRLFSPYQSLAEFCATAKGVGILKKNQAIDLFVPKDEPRISIFYSYTISGTLSSFTYYRLMPLDLGSLGDERVFFKIEGVGSLKGELSIEKVAREEASQFLNDECTMGLVN